MYTAELILGVFMVITLAVGLWAGKGVKTMKDYALANRSLGTGVLTMTLLATFIGQGDLFKPNYVTGGSGTSAYLPGSIGCVFSFLLVGCFLAPKFLKLSNCLTLGDVMGQFYGQYAKILAGLLGFGFTCLVVGGNLKALYILLPQFLGLNDGDEQLVFLLIGFIIVLYTCLGGMRSVAVTDVLQLLAAVLVVCLIAWTMLYHAGGPRAVYNELPKEKFTLYTLKGLLVSFCWFFIPTSILSPPYFQRLLSVKQKNFVGSSFKIAAAVYVAFRSLIFIIGLSAAKLSSEKFSDSRAVFPYAIQKFFSDYPVLQGLLVVGLIAILMSTIDSFLHAGAVSLTHDVIQPVYGTGRIRIDEVKTAKWTCGLIGVLAIAASFIPGNPEVVVMYGMTLLSSTTIPLIAALLGLKVDQKSFFIALGVGVLAYLVSFLCFFHEQATYIKACLDWIFALFFHTVAFFGSVYYQNGGFVIEKARRRPARGWARKEPSLRQKIGNWIPTPTRLVKIAQQRVKRFGYEPTLVSIFITISYMLPFVAVYSATGKQNQELLLYLFGLNCVGMLLCIGLLLEPYWPKRYQYLFPLFWYLTLFYCIPFTTTLLFLKEPGNPMMGISIAINLLLLAALVDWISFSCLLGIGVGLAVLLRRIFGGPIELNFAGNTDSMFQVFYGTLAALTIGYLFAYRREQHQGKRLNQSKLLAGSVAHEVNNHLTFTLYAAGVVDQFLASSSEEDKEKLKVIGPLLRQQSKKANIMVKRFMKALREDLPTKTPPYSLKGAIEKTLETTMVQGNLKGAKINKELEKDFESTVPPEFWEHILGNLIKNAVHHGEAEEITVKLEGEERVLRVRDNGKGIAPEKVPHIFDLFYTKGKEGTGLGLALVQELITCSGGGIECESKQGEGSYTEFVITLAI